MELTYREAWIYLCAALIFAGSILGIALAHRQAQVQLHGLAAVLLVLPASAVITIMSIAYSVAARALPRLGHPAFTIAWGQAAIWLMWGLALPAALRRLRRRRLRANVACCGTKTKHRVGTGGRCP